MKTRLAVIGNGMAAGRLLDELTGRDASRLDVTVFGEEPHGCYNRILLGRVVGGADPADILLKTPAWYTDRGVALHTGRKVTALDPAARRLTTADGQTHRYDAAVFATGSAAVVPPLTGLPRAGSFVFRTVEDCQAIRAYARPAMSAVVLGGGLLGLEAAAALSDLGLYVTVVHQAGWLMNRQLDSTAGEFLRRGVEKLGLFVRTGARAAGVVGDDRIEGVTLDTSEVIPADVLVLAAGIRPRTELAAAANVPVNRGILVNDRLATAVPGLSAVGECAEHAGVVYGVVPPIWEQCGVLADLLTGRDPAARYTGSKLYTRLKLAGVEVAQMGDPEPAAGDEVVQVVEDRRGVYRRLVVRNDRLVGATLVGDASAAPGLAGWFDRGDPLPANRLDLLASGEVATSAADREVCNCHRVKESVIREAVRDGCTSLPLLAARTMAGTGCGSCRGALADLILSTQAAPA